MELSPSAIAIERLPKHLRKYVVPQDYEAYTPRDQAVWRYVMRLNVAHLRDKAHPAYLKGLEATGIEVDKIPSMDDMNRCLNKLGWSAVCVNGFIPPKVFMELQSLGFLPIAQDIRTHEHIAYTPAPDIIHEAAGHAPIVYDPAYAAYLREFGRIGMTAISSREDFEVYEAIRNLSIVKEAPDSSKEEIAAAEKRLQDAIAANSGNSESNRLTRMHWWTTEYGLIGNLEAPRIFGAGLLSSVGESATCLLPEVAKIPLSVGCTEQDYDITEPQPQLFVCEDFAELKQVLDIFAGKMAVNVGGLRAVRQGLEAKDVTTTELDTMLQISGIMDMVVEKNDELLAIRWLPGKTGLSVKDKMIPLGYDESRMLLIMGKLADGHHPVKQEFEEDQQVELTFLNGFRVSGRVTDSVAVKGITRGLVLGEGRVVDPDGNNIDMGSAPFLVAFGTTVDAVFGGPADRQVWEDLYGEPLSLAGYLKEQADAKEAEAKHPVMEAYARVRALRESGSDVTAEAADLLAKVRSSFPDEWLLPLELIELLVGSEKHQTLVDDTIAGLKDHPQWEDLEKGLALLDLAGAPQPA